MESGYLPTTRPLGCIILLIICLVTLHGTLYVFRITLTDKNIIFYHRERVAAGALGESLKSHQKGIYYYTLFPRWQISQITLFIHASSTLLYI